ncbi:hypothetical protein, partial [Acinetobacter baumannii]
YFNLVIGTFSQNTESPTNPVRFIISPVPVPPKVTPTLNPPSSPVQPESINKPTDTNGSVRRE